MEAFYLERALMDQRAFAAAFDTTAAQARVALGAAGYTWPCSESECSSPGPAMPQVKRTLLAALQGLAELRTQLAAPARADLPRLAEQLGAVAAALDGWVQRYETRADQASGPVGGSAWHAAAGRGCSLVQSCAALLCRPPQSCQADPLAEVADWQAGILAALPALRPTTPPPLQHVSALIVHVYAHHMRQLPLQGPPEER